MRIRSAFDIRPEILRLLRLIDTSATEAYVEPYSVVRSHPSSGATSTRVVYRMDDTLYRFHPYEHSDAVITDDGYSLTEADVSEDEDLKRDQGSRWAKTAHPNLTA